MAIVAASVLSEMGKALSFSFGMLWEIQWALILGFALSALVQAVVSKREMRRLLPDDSPRSIGLACGLGAASSSCSYLAIAAVLVWRFVRAGGLPMLRTMNKPATAAHETHSHAD